MDLAGRGGPRTFGGGQEKQLVGRFASLFDDPSRSEDHQMYLTSAEMCRANSTYYHSCSTLRQ